MTVKELINELLECPMGAEVSVLVEMHKDFMKKRLEQSQDYSFPVCDDAAIKYVFEESNSRVRIYLTNAEEWV